MEQGSVSDWSGMMANVTTRVGKIEGRVYERANARMQDTIRFLRARWDQSRRCAVVELIQHEEFGEDVPEDVLETGRAALREVRSSLTESEWADLWPINLQESIDA
jgi:hypothetical protein